MDILHENELRNLRYHIIDLGMRVIIGLNQFSSAAKNGEFLMPS